MLKLYRRVLAAGAVAVGLAACGDKVTSVSPTPPGVHSVTVAPATVNMTIGQSVTFAASVDADSGFATTVTWTSSDPTIASVNGSTGVVTAVAAGTTTIIATSTANTAKTGVASVTVAAPPPGLISFSVTPQSVTLDPGATVQAAANIVTQPGVSAPSVSWSSGNSSIASVSGSGLITAVSAGTAVISASITLGGQTLSASIAVTVNHLIPASVSIKDVTAGATTVPVNLTNVMGQIEINMNFDPGDDIVDSVNVYIMPGTSAPTSTTKPAAQQVYATNPSAGLIDLSVPTQRFTKNAAAGTATVDFQNGQVTVYAMVFPHGKTAINASNTVQMVLNNADGWAADIAGDTFANTNRVAGSLPTSANSAGGVTFWGGPGAAGLVSVELYPVVYTPNRSISTVTWTMGPGGIAGCSTVTQTALPFKATFGYTNAGATKSCTGYENTTGAAGVRDNVVVTIALDNQNNTYPLVNAAAPLIPNIVWLGGTPDSLRLDYKAPSVTTPTIARSAPAVTGWVNAAFSFNPAASTDGGVGVKAGSRLFFYNAPNCGGATNVAMPTGTGADIPECPTNTLGGTPGLGLPGTAPYDTYMTETDLLLNLGTSSLTQTFGVDKTAPSIRWGIGGDATYTNAAVTPDDTIYATPGEKPGMGAHDLATDFYRVEFLDLNPVTNVVSGFATGAQVQSLDLSNHANPTGVCVVGGDINGPGANFVTAATCKMTTATLGSLRLDGWLAGNNLAVLPAEGYQYYRSQVTDEAGNASSILHRVLLVNTNNPLAATLGITQVETATNMSFFSTFADSAEVIKSSMQLVYPLMDSIGSGFGAAGLGIDSVRYPQVALPQAMPAGLCGAVAAAFDDCITSPYSGLVAPGTPTPYVRGLEIVTAAAFPASNVPSPYDAAWTKPTKVLAWSWNPGGHSSAAPETLLPGLDVEAGTGVAAWNAANPTLAVVHFRIDSTISDANFFGSGKALRAQVAAPTNSPNAPFSRVDFYRLDGGGTWWNYLGTAAGASALASDQGTYRSWVYALTGTDAAGDSLATKDWAGNSLAPIGSGNVIVAIGVLPNGDALATGRVTMLP
jgi:Bacterial Ig-like domain (group 2)